MSTQKEGRTQERSGPETAGLLVADRAGQILFCNGDAEKLLDKSADAIMHQDVYTLLPFLEERTGSHLYQSGSRSLLWQRVSLPAMAPSDAAECILLMDLKYLEPPQFLLEQHIRENLQEIIEGSFDGLLVTDGDGNVQMVNQAYVQNTGIQKEQLVGHNMSELVNPVWMKQSVVFLVMQQQGPVSLQHETQNGKHIIVTGMPVFGPKGNIKRIVVNSRDISEIYALNQKLQATNSMKEYYAQSLEMYEQTPDNQDRLVIYSNKLQNVFYTAKKVSTFNTSVLITGESGVGKEEVARYIHTHSLRSEKPFVAVNCGAIPENLLESELFGYEGGAFTGALRGGKAGLFESASGGTLLLDEIGEMPLALQVKLLRVLEKREVVRIGGTKAIPVDVRLLSATNEDLSEMVRKGAFREDLYYRINVIRIHIPPLRERVEDIPLLSLKFMRMFNMQYGTNKRLTYAVVQEFQKYPWPGNVRELKNTIENMLVLSCRDYIQVNDIPWRGAKGREPISYETPPEEETLPLEKAMEQYERQLLLAASERCSSTREMAARLKVNQSTVVRKLKKYGITL